MTLTIPPPQPIPTITRLLSLFNFIWITITHNLLAWHSRPAKPHHRADLIGRRYVPGAPEIGVAAGKGILGAMEDMKSTSNAGFG